MLSHYTKRFLKSKAGHHAASWLIARYAKFVIATSRWTFDVDSVRTLLDAGRPVFVVLWHNRVALLPFGWNFPGYRLTVLISDHRDGRVIAGVLDAAGVDYYRVPASAAGGRTERQHKLHRASSARQIRRLSASGRTISVVGDGPKGPRFVLNAFALDLARLCDAEVVLTAYSVKRRIIAHSWDRLIVPLPFNRGIFRTSTRSYDIRNLDAAAREVMRRRIERDLRAFTDETDAMMGHPPIE